MAAVPTGAPGGAGDASELDVDPIKSLLDLSLDARAAWQHSEHRAHFAALNSRSHFTIKNEKTPLSC